MQKIYPPQERSFVPAFQALLRFSIEKGGYADYLRPPFSLKHTLPYSLYFLSFVNVDYRLYVAVFEVLVTSSTSSPSL